MSTARQSERRRRHHIEPEDDMSKTSNRAWRVVGGGVGAVALFGLGHVAARWLRYGHVRKHRGPPTLLDRFLPEPEVLERHHTKVKAPVDITYAAARDMSLAKSRLVRTIFRGRELLMRSTAADERPPQSLIDDVLSIGWGVLAQESGREMVLGAVTQPWKGDVKFRALPPDEFATFDEPGFAKIAWTIQARPIGPDTSWFYTETRVATTDPEARKHFRRYWTAVSPGVRIIRRESLRLVRADAERRYRAALEAAPATGG
jgi:hypothetical protein